ncbi:MAG TPA: ABC transporter permease [Candidatus Acidoferrum sp.]|nr:ABC transporter permease [Candidatus Acidoferrum sp.]
MLSAALGVIGVVCSVNYGEGGTKQILDQIRRMGTNVLIISPAQSRTIAGRARTGALVTTLVERDYRVMENEILSRTHSSAFVTQSFWSKAGDFSKNTVVVGCEPDYFVIKSWSTIAGDLFESIQERDAARVAVLGHTVAVDLFGASSPIGQRMMINRVPFTVVGVLSERGQGLDVSNEDSQVYVPLSTAMHRLMNVDHFAGIALELDTLDSMDATAETCRSLLRALHHIQPSQPDDFQIQNQKSLIDTQAAAAKRLGLFLRWIGASALAVSGLGIVAITWIAVKERTHEIGTRRALGATAANIFLQMICETLALALAGELLGIAFSWPTSLWISDSVQLPFVFDRDSALLAFVASTTLNLAFSILPSRKAASISPLEALRFE